jgi:hypothetical protein
MGILRCMTPQIGKATSDIIKYIATLKDEQRKLAIDEKVVNSARVEFQNNLFKNKRVTQGSRYLFTIGCVSLIGAVPVAYFSGQKKSGLLGIIATICIVVSYYLGNKEERQLMAALHLKPSEGRVEALALGADLNAKVWAWGDGKFHLGANNYNTLSSAFAKKGDIDSLAYTLLMEEDAHRRITLATLAIAESGDVHVVEFLSKFNPRIDNIRFWNAAYRQKYDVVKALYNLDVSAAAQINDYKKWQEDLNAREPVSYNPLENLDCGKDEGRPRLSYGLEPSFHTPLEQLLIGRHSNIDGDKISFRKLHVERTLEAFNLNVNDLKVLSIEKMWEAINEKGIRVRKEYVEVMHRILNAEE